MNKIVKKLKVDRKEYLKIETFSSNPGIYALFFTGNSFPLANYSPKEDEIIYIGKTESSQASRDRDTHFASGRTGSSTLRRSFGSMLRNKLNLNPIPRGQADIDKNRTSHFKFDNASEEILSEWMQNNLALSFHEYNGTTGGLDELESNLISFIKPVLNIDRKNPKNPYKNSISALRKETGLIAYGSSNGLPRSSEKKVMPKVKSVKTKPVVSSNLHKYEDIWKQVIRDITNAVNSDTSIEVNIGSAPFKAVGNRKSYSFRLQIRNGLVANNIGGSAVARDLARILLNNSEFKNAISSKDVTLRLDKDFNLHIATC